MSKSPDPSTPDHQIPSLTLGKRLSSQRQARHLSIEDVARTLRLRANLIREIEQDDLRSFDHPSYARLTILSYSRFLGIPDAEILPWLPEPGSISSSNYQYMEHLSEPEPITPEDIYSPAPQKKKWPQTAIIITGLLILIVLAAYGALLWNNLNRLTPKSSNLPHSAPQNQQNSTTQPSQELELEQNQFQYQSIQINTNPIDLNVQYQEAQSLHFSNETTPTTKPTQSTSPTPQPSPNPTPTPSISPSPTPPTSQRNHITPSPGTSTPPPPSSPQPTTR
ncbi:MAG: helix-turn-helix domain-containing protein [Chthoniobacterales bacterium]|nr:helix-turn-helix domain-containing protein [Chthoniobacterales bacterium]